MNKNDHRRFLRAVTIFACLAALPIVVQADVFNMPSGQVSLQTVSVGDAGNAADTQVMTTDSTTGYGAVGYNYRIGTYDVTNAQYVEFLNAKATTSDPYGLYFTNMASDTQGGITRSGAGPFTYAVKPGLANKPVVDVSWCDSIRFSNWLANGQGAGDTESGTYTITGGGVDSGTVAVPDAPQRAAWALNGPTHWLLPSENEWYKAAYYKGGGTNAGYWSYPFKSNAAPTGDAPPGGSNSANFYGNNGYAVTQSTSHSSSQVYLTDVGAYISAMSPYGAFDMGGDVFQWDEGLFSAGTRVHRGGSWTSFGTQFLAATGRDFDQAGSEITTIGFRVVSLGNVPEPGSLTLLAVGAIGLLLWARRRSA